MLLTTNPSSPWSKRWHHQSDGQLQLEEQLLKTITDLRLPFQVVEDSAFQQLLNLIHYGPQRLELPFAKTFCRRLRDAVIEQRTLQLKDLPEDTRVLLVLGCWTSPFQKAFMAITVYFVDTKWNYKLGSFFLVLSLCMALIQGST